MPPTTSEEFESRSLCNRLMREAAKLENGGTFSLAEEDLSRLTATDRNRLLSFVQHEKHLLAKYDGRARVDPPGPGHYTDGLRQGSALRRERVGGYTRRFVPEMNRFTDDRQPKRNFGKNGEGAGEKLPPLPPSPRTSLQPGPSLGTRHADAEERWRRDHARLGPGLYNADKPASNARPPVTMKFRRGGSTLGPQDPCPKPGPGTYSDTPSAFPYTRPTAAMHPVSRVKVQTITPGPGAYNVSTNAADPYATTSGRSTQQQQQQGRASATSDSKHDKSGAPPEEEEPVQGNADAADEQPASSS